MKIISGTTRFDVFLVVLLGLLWGSVFVAIEICLEVIHPLHIVFARTVLGCCAVFIYLYYKKLPFFCKGHRGWLAALIIGFFNVLLPSALISWAQLHIPSSTTAMVFALGPILSTIANHLLTRDDLINVPKIIGIVMAFTGFMISVGNPHSFSQGFDLHMILAIGSIFLANLCQIVSGVALRYIKVASPVSLVGNIFIICFLVSLPLLFVVDFSSSLLEFDARHILAILYLGLLSTGFAYTIRFILILRIGQSYTSMAAYMIPPVGTLLGWLLLGEFISIYVILSLPLILFGMYIARKGQLLNANRARSRDDLIAD